MKDGLKDFGFFTLLEALFSTIYFLGKDKMFDGIYNLLSSAAQDYPFLANMNFSGEVLTWLIALVTVPFSAAIPYHFRLTREVNKYKGEGLVVEVSKQLSEFRGELNTIKRIIDDVSFEQNNLRQSLDYILKAHPQLKKAVEAGKKQREEED